MKRFLLIFATMTGCVQHSPNARVSVPIEIQVSVVPAVTEARP